MEHRKIDPNEVFENKYFILNKRMLRLISLWPYQKTWNKILTKIYLSLAILSMMIPQMIRAIEEFLKEDMEIEILLENIAGFCYFLGIIAKFVTSALAEPNLQLVYEEITKDWKEITDDEEKKILRHFASEGRLLTICYTAYMYGSCILYITSTAVIPIFLNAIIKKEEPFKKNLCIHAEYFVDQDEYFAYLFFITLASGIVTIAISSGVDGTFVNCIQHILGLFNIIKYRLEELNEIVSDPVRYNSKDIEEVLNTNIMYCIKVHKRCLEFTDWLQEAYNECFFFVSALLIIGLATFSVDLLMNIDRPINFLRIFTLWFGVIIYLFYISWPGQKLIDNSNELFIWIYSSGWYQFPRKSKNDIRLMMLRATRPCMITAGPLLVMNFETCSIILRSAFSYFTAVTSMK